MNTGRSTAAALPPRDDTAADGPSAVTVAGSATPAASLPPITTRWAPTQRNGVPPVRRRPDPDDAAPGHRVASAGGSLVAVGPVPDPASADASADRAPGRVLPLEDETTRRVVAQTRAIGQAILEVLAGSRPAGQLVRWMDPTVHEALVLRAELVRSAALRADTARTGQRGGDGRRMPFRQATVRSVHACRVSARCYETSLVVGEPGRCRAMALRLELRHLQWRVTALQLG